MNWSRHEAKVSQRRHHEGVGDDAMDGEEEEKKKKVNETR